MTHFTVSNLLDAAVSTIGLNALPALYEGGVLAHHFSPTGNESLAFCFKCLVTTYLVSSYALEHGGPLEKLAYTSEKAMRITMPAVYLVTAWNALQIGLHIFK